MDGFFKKVNWKVNPGRRWMPDAHPPNAHQPWHHYFKGQIFRKKPSKKHLEVFQAAKQQELCRLSTGTYCKDKIRYTRVIQKIMWTTLLVIIWNNKLNLLKSVKVMSHCVQSLTVDSVASVFLLLGNHTAITLEPAPTQHLLVSLSPQNLR